MTILGIETSCDETAIALIDVFQKNSSLKVNILSNEIASQVKVHAPFGGVVPGIAAREHIGNIDVLMGKIISKSGAKSIEALMEQIDSIAITNGPGLMPCLLIGAAFAKSIAFKYSKKIFGINHLEGHLFSGLLGNTAESDIANFQFPAIGLIVSGGHTELVLVNDVGSYNLIGETLDDAAGEAFDKVARLLDLGYPGGPIIEERALNGDPRAFPRPMINSHNYNFSFAGLKTAVLYKLADIKKQLGDDHKIDNQTINNLAASFQQAVIDTLIGKLKKAISKFNPKSIFLGGGVLANQQIQSAINNLNLEQIVYMPQKKYCGDNAVMIALALCLNKENRASASWNNLEINPNLTIN